LLRNYEGANCAEVWKIPISDKVVSILQARAVRHSSLCSGDCWAHVRSASVRDRKSDILNWKLRANTPNTSLP